MKYDKWSFDDERVAILLVVALFLLVQAIHNVTVFPYDAKEYWHLSSPTVFFNFPKSLRGYFYPLLLLPAHFLSNIFGWLDHLSYRIYSAVVLGYSIAILLPAFYKQTFGGELTLWRRLIVPVLLITLLPGVIIYPLSDLPAFLLMFGSIYALQKAIFALSKLKKAGFLFLAGTLAAGAYNTRTIYLFPMIGIFIMISFRRWSSHANHLWAILAFITGIGMVSLPQSIINQRVHGSRTSAVIAQQTSKSLFALQLLWGVTVQRYETSADPTIANPGRLFMDKAGEQLFAREALDQGEVSVGRYLSVVAQNPTAFPGIYGRHFNGLDLRDGTVYVKDTEQSDNGVENWNLVVIFIAVLAIFVRYVNRKDCSPGRAVKYFPFRSFADPLWLGWLSVLLLPVCAIFPGAIETRFFLPLHLLLYCTIAFNSSVNELIIYIKRNWLVIIGGGIVLCALFVAISTNTMSCMQRVTNLPYRPVP